MDMQDEAEELKKLLPDAAAQLIEMAGQGIDTVAEAGGLLSFASGFSVAIVYDARDGSQIEIKLSIGAPEPGDDEDNDDAG